MNNNQERESTIGVITLSAIFCQQSTVKVIVRGHNLHAKHRHRVNKTEAHQEQHNVVDGSAQHTGFVALE